MKTHTRHSVAAEYQISVTDLSRRISKLRRRGLDVSILRQDLSSCLIETRNGRLVYPHRISALVDHVDTLEQSVARMTGLIGVRPPINADYLLYLMLPAKHRDTLIDDLHEEYDSVIIQFGERRAHFWYWAQVIGSLWPLLTSNVKSKLPWVVSVAGWISRKKVGL